jgi:ABC-type antimicrobial peptide transport system permease subunit
VGVVGGVHHDGLDQPATPTLYTPLAQAPRSSHAFLAGRLFLVVRGDALSPDAIVREIHHLDREVPAFDARTLSQRLGSALGPRRFVLALLAAFGAAALLLATLGVAAVVSVAVAQRTRELGIRRALGAQSGDLARMVLWGAARLGLLGVALGALASLGLTRLLSSMLFGVSAFDPLTFAAVAALLLAATLAAALLPARAAMRADPLEALRAE